MKVWRCGILLVERRAALDDPLLALVSRDGARGARGTWVALAPHLDDEVVLDRADLAALEDAPAERGAAVDAADLAQVHGTACIARLLDTGLLLGDHAAGAPRAAADAAVRATDWWPVAAVAQRFGRWRDVDVSARPVPEGGFAAGLLARRGPPPPAHAPRGDATRTVSLPRHADGAFDALLAARSTCRNFSDAPLSLEDLSAVLRRSLGAQAVHAFAQGAAAFKKHSPSGGGLHPVDGYVLARRVDGLPPGPYHYDPVANALRPLDSSRVPAEDAADDFAGAARRLVAGQPWFADAPVLVLLAAHFQRSYWKYPRHAKAWKVIQLDAGHVSQTLQLSATERGLGAFVTAAIDDAHAERLFGLDGLSIGAVAVCGVGRRAARLPAFEFDPLGLAVR